MYGKMFGVGQIPGKTLGGTVARSTSFRVTDSSCWHKIEISALQLKLFQSPASNLRDRELKEDMSFMCQELSTSGLSESIIITKSKTGFAVAVIRLGGSLGNFKFKMLSSKLSPSHIFSHRVTVHLHI